MSYTDIFLVKKGLCVKLGFVCVMTIYSKNNTLIITLVTKTQVRLNQNCLIHSEKVEHF